MKHLRRFNESLNIYDIDWHEIVPKKLTMIYDDKSYNFICDQSTNIMKHFDMIQVTYTLEGGESWGVSDCLEFDLYFLKPYNSKVIKFEGFYKIYREDYDEKAEDDEYSRKLPELAVSQNLYLEGVKPNQHFTEPPSRYGEASLVKKMEELEKEEKE
mgnify:CR=1 FL=1